ncbi:MULTISPECIES: DnaB-like helicase N-terminal domain-containing protein [unclassified Streptomyces]|uniref:DnaB-like helicase N-terminal domain-containing protein n=1 Tax=unclassified Streptomyces TaxID=2593676 RepID=UPI0036454896
MPHIPDDSLAEPALPRAVHFAEQALLGALLLEPHRTAGIGLEAEHFSNRTHGILFAAMRRVPPPDPQHHATDAAWLAAVYAEARPRAPGLPHTYPHTLVQACPRPEHATAYARMVRADHARRTLRMHAERLAWTAGDTTLPDRAAATAEQADRLAVFLEELLGEFPPHPGSLPRTTLPPGPMRSPEDDTVDDERLLLASATASPRKIHTMRWLRPTDFVVPDHGALWQVLTGLVHRREPVDPVTVLWQAQQSGTPAGAFTTRGLLALLSAPHGSPEHWGERIVRRALLHHAHTVADRITAFADDPANTPYQLIAGSRRTLVDFAVIRTRWQRSTSPATPVSAHTSAASRAGPPRTFPSSPVRATR